MQQGDDINIYDAASGSKVKYIKDTDYLRWIMAKQYPIRAPEAWRDRTKFTVADGKQVAVTKDLACCKNTAS